MLSLAAIISLTILIICATLHEMAHGYVAEKLGDPTARLAGRISFNPIRHIDPFMTVILPALLIMSGSPIIFGGAKPIPVDPRYFRKPLQGMAIVAAAGPISNALLALLGIAFIKGIMFLDFADHVSPEIFVHTIRFLFAWVIINAILGLFNLFPLPPLDGGRIVMGLLPRQLAIPYAKLERHGLIIIFALLYFGVIGSFLNPFMEGIENYLKSLILIK